MASASSLSVSVECVNACKLLKGEREGSGGGRNNDCSVVSCAWRAPRVLTGFLASTAHPYSCPRTGRTRRSRLRCDALDIRGSFSNESSATLLFHRCCKSTLLHVPNKKWQRCCSSDACGEVSPESLWLDLKQSIAYLPTKELDMVHNALNVAFEAHEGQKRRSGEPFIIHPVEVARILGELELDWESIAAGLLHDTVEDTNVVTFERIEEDFGPTVRRIVEGETKVSKLGKLKCKVERDLVQDVKAEDLRQMFLAMTEEVRVIIVKLADRLHNMRTLSHMPAHKQEAIAKETLQIFAPLAKLLGIYKIKCELENLSFMYTNPEDFQEVKSKIADLYTDHEKEITEANKILRKKIEEDQFLARLTMNAEVLSMCKEPYSVYKTVKKSNGSISEVNQIAQLRIVIKPNPSAGIGPLCSSKQICYHVLGLVHSLWTPVPRSMKDYIATSKPNGYQSLHTTVIPFLYESMFQLEVQIRTEEMDLIAERGIAAHYSGHDLPIWLNNTNIALRIGWLNAIREWQEEFVGNMSSREFVETITRDLLDSRIFVFSPKGEIRNLPKGATVIDYAYMIDTEIGNKMIGGKVNGNKVYPAHVLANAEVVEIITYNELPRKSAYKRHKKWLQHAKTFSARHKITMFLEELGSLFAGEIEAEANTVDEKLREEISGGNAKRQDLDKWSRGSHSDDLCSNENGRALVPKVNGKPSKHLQNASFSADSNLSQEIGVAQVMQEHISSYKEVLRALESWQASKVADWHTLEGHSIQWLSVVCIDRRGMMGKVTTALEATDISICSCVAEIDKGWGMAVMLFHVEGELDALVKRCSNLDLIPGVLGWSTGCSIANQRVYEC